MIRCCCSTYLKCLNSFLQYHDDEFRYTSDHGYNNYYNGRNDRQLGMMLRENQHHVCTKTDIIGVSLHPGRCLPRTAIKIETANPAPAWPVVSIISDTSVCHTLSV